MQIAASMGLQKGFTEATPILLEPIMNVEVTAPRGLGAARRFA